MLQATMSVSHETMLQFSIKMDLALTSDKVFKFEQKGLFGPNFVTSLCSMKYNEPHDR